jgi:hypothetical protein
MKFSKTEAVLVPLSQSALAMHGPPTMPSSGSEPTRARRQWTEEVDLGLGMDVIGGRGSSQASLDVEAVTRALGAVEGV